MFSSCGVDVQDPVASEESPLSPSVFVGFLKRLLDSPDREFVAVVTATSVAFGQASIFLLTPGWHRLLIKKSGDQVELIKQCYLGV